MRSPLYPILVGAAVIVVTAAFLWLRPSTTAPAPILSPSTALSLTNSALVTNVPPAVAMRMLGLHLLTSANTDEIRNGMNTLVAAAERDNVEAQVSLGRIYLQGLPTVPKNAEKAWQWFDRAWRRHRHPSAAYFLGTMSQSGQGGQADPVQAAQYFDKAADQGLPHAMFMLANAYASGTGVPQNTARAIAWYEKAAMLEYAPALQTLAMAYQNGELGVQPDETEARRYFLEAEHAIKHVLPPP